MRLKFGSHYALTYATGLFLMFHCSIGSQGTYDCQSYNFSVTADDYMVLYVDEKLVTKVGVGSLGIVELNCSTQVIAILAVNTGLYAGIRGSDEIGNILTNNTWKCTSTTYYGWTTADFDDSSWPPANVTNKSDANYIEGIRNDSQWIWTKDYLNDFSPVYCRKTLHQPTGFTTEEPRSTGYSTADLGLTSEKFGVSFYVVVAIMGFFILLSAALIVILIIFCFRKNKTTTPASTSTPRIVLETGQTRVGEVNNCRNPDSAYEQLNDNEYQKVYTELCN